MIPATEQAADAAWQAHADNLALVRRVTLDPRATDAQRRRAIEMSIRSERQFRDAFLALDHAPALPAAANDGDVK